MDLKHYTKKQIIFVVGSPKSGKQTQCERLERDYKFKLLKIDQLFQQEIQANTTLGQEIQAVLNNQQEVPSGPVCQLIAQAIKSDTKSQKFVVNGFPRNLDDAIYFESHHQIEIEVLLNIECSSEVLAQRGILNSNNQDEIMKQVAHFQQNTLPVIDFYWRFGRVINIQTNGTIQQVYNHIIVPSIKPNLIFFYGPPALGKSSVAKSLAQRLNYVYFDLIDFYQKRKLTDDAAKVNALIQFFSQTKERNFIIDHFLDNSVQVKTFFEHFNQPLFIFNFTATKDVVDRNINEFYPNKNDRVSLRNQYENHMTQRKKLLEMLSGQSYFKTIEIPSNYNISLSELESNVLSYIAPEVYVANFNENIELFNEFVQDLEEKKGFIHIAVNQLIQKEMQRKTHLGDQLCGLTNTGKIVTLEYQLELIRKIIFQQPIYNKRFLITGLPNSVADLLTFEKQVCPIRNYMHFAKKEENPKFNYFYPALTAQSYFFTLGKLINIDRHDMGVVEQFMTEQPKYGFVVGPLGTGKTAVSKQLESRFGFQLVDYEKTIEMLKVKLGGPDGPLEEVPFAALVKYFKEILCKQQQKDVLLFDGFPPAYDLHQLNDMVKNLGEPSFVVNLKVDKNTAALAFKRKNEMEAGAELGEEDNEKIDKDLARYEHILHFFQSVSKHSNRMNLFDCNVSGMKLAQLLNTIEGLFFKRVITCNLNMNQDQTDKHWKRYSDLLANICTHNSIIYVDVRKLIQHELSQNGPLSDKLNSQYKMRWTDAPIEYPSNYTPGLIVQLVKSYLSTLQYNIRDLLVFGFPSGDSFKERKEDEQFFPRVLDEINEIENNLGPIQTSIVITNQYLSSEYNDPIQEKVVVEEEAKEQIKQVGEDGEEIPQPEVQEEEEGADKGPKFNPQDFSWSLSNGNSKDIAQIFHKFKNSKEERFEAHFDNLQKIGESIVHVIQLWESGEKQIKLVQILNTFE